MARDAHGDDREPSGAAAATTGTTAAPAASEARGHQPHLQALWAVAAQAERCICYRPPEMEAYWHPDFHKRLTDALDAALRAGVTPDNAFDALLAAAAPLPGAAVPWPLLRRCAAAGLAADTDVGGGAPLLLHLLARPRPPPLDPDDYEGGGGGNGSSSHAPKFSSAPEGEEDDKESCPVSLGQLLATATPDMPGPRGNTALHLVVAGLVERTHSFPDRELEGLSAPRAAEAGGGGAAGKAAAAAAVAAAAGGAAGGDGAEFARQAAADAARAAYAETAFAALLRAGWSATARNARGNSVADVVALAVRQCGADLDEIRDPRGLPRAALAEYVAAEGVGEGGGGGGRGDEARLRELVEAHERGAAAVLSALGRMEALAAAQRRPGAARGVVVLLVVWAALVAVAWQWLVVAPRRE